MKIRYINVLASLKTGSQKAFVKVNERCGEKYGLKTSQIASLKLRKKIANSTRALKNEAHVLYKTLVSLLPSIACTTSPRKLPLRARLSIRRSMATLETWVCSRSGSVAPYPY